MSVSLHSFDEHQKIFTAFLPKGDVFDAKSLFGTNFFDLLSGLSKEFERTELLIKDICEELDPRTADFLLPNWEKVVGIPDDCFKTSVAIEQRRLNVVIKFANMNISTEEEFLKLAGLLGFTVEINKETPFTVPPYDVPFIPTSSAFQDAFVWTVTGPDVFPNLPPYDVPFIPSSGASSILACVFEKLKPAMTKIIFRNP